MALVLQGGVKMMEGREARLVLGMVEVTAAAQMDEEVNSVSGSHGNPPDKDHHWMVRRESSEMITTF